MTESNWHHATTAPPLHCPVCFAANLEPPAKPTLEREQNGSISCTCCGHNWRPGDPPPKQAA